MTCLASKPDSRSSRLTSAETEVLCGARPFMSKGNTPPAPGARTGAARPSVLRIDRPGTHRLVADVTGTPESAAGILITCDNVTLDLAGFSVVGVGAPGVAAVGILVLPGCSNIVIRNGTVRGWGEAGIDLDRATDSHLTDLRLCHNAGGGARLGHNCSAQRISAWSNGAEGLDAGNGCTLREVESRANAGTGVRAGDSACLLDVCAAGNARDGISVGAGSVVRDAVCRHNAGTGLSAGPAASIRGCDLLRNEKGGIVTGEASAVADNRCLGVDGPAPLSTGPGSTLDRNICPGSDRTGA